MKIGKQGDGGGRKRKFDSAKALDERINAYFEARKKDEDPVYQIPSISGLSLFLGFGDVKSLYEYEQTAKFGPCVKKARSRIENAIEQRLLAGKPPIGLIFALKNRFQWQDTQKMDFTSNGETLGIIQLPQRKA